MPLSSRSLRRGPLLTLAVAIGFAASLAPAQAVTSAPAGPRPVSASNVVSPRQAAARSSLDRVQGILSPKSSQAAHDQLTSVKDPTLAMIDLWRDRGALSRQDRATAARATARPAKADKLCNSSICVHYNRSEVAANYPAQVLGTVSSVRTTYRKAGFRSPKPDGGLGGDKRTDIYLDDIGDQGLYGYCTTDQTKPVAPGRYDVWAYCVLDNDYSKAEFPANTPLQNLQVTAAHEFFHAVQFAYDILDDQWLLEGTAVWAEDELFTSINDNLQYLPTSPLTQPGRSLDTGGGFNVYGDWIFFRYLSEHFKKSQGGLPVIIRDIWRAADSSKGAKRNRYSVQAIDTVLKRHGTSLSQQFIRFAVANRTPQRTYREGRANAYPAVAPAGTSKLGLKQRKASGKADLNHLASVTGRLLPRGLDNKQWKVKVAFNMADKARGSMAAVTVYFKNGKVKTSYVQLSKKGAATKSVAFSSKRVRYVEVTMANASTRYRCNRGTRFSCAGKPLDQKVLERFTAKAYK